MSSGHVNSTWNDSTLGDIATFVNGFGFGQSQWQDVGDPIIRIENMRDPAAGSNRYAGVLPERYRVDSGDILLSWSATLMALIWDRGPAWVNQHIFKVSPKNCIDSHFLYHLLSYVLIDLSVQSHGTTMRHIKRSDLLPFRVCIPPASEQRPIADVLDTVDEDIRATERLVAKLEQAKQGILHDLLTRVIAECGKATPLGDVSIIAGGVTLGRSISGSGSIELPYLRVANVQDGFIDTSEMKKVRILRTELERYQLRVGDVLMTEGGDFDKLGRGAVWDGSIDPCLHQNHIFRVRCDPSVLLPQFLAMYSASPAGRRHFVLISKQTTNLASINMTQLKAFPLPIPPLQEQACIVTAAEAQDNEIRGELEVLRKLRLLKLGLTDDLLTGRVRIGAST